MSANRKSVFLSDHALDILGPFSSGRLNGIIEKYGYLIQTQELDATFSPSDLATDLPSHSRKSHPRTCSHGKSSLQQA
jgi:hypothetical protein